ncbi:hypothetical protein MBLNU459_g4500t1 [Dothideomycetes sp. NU459]
MAPILHLVRHGQGYHSVLPAGHTVRDPELTPHGEEQCRELRDKFAYHEQVGLLLASPMRRTLQTALLAFAPCTSRGLRVMGVPGAQEATDDASDTGSELATLRAWCDGKPVDLGFVGDGWEAKSGGNACDVATLKARARKLRRWIRERDEGHVVLVSHGFFAHYLTGSINDKGEQTTTWWTETEHRSFHFEGADDEAMIKETEESRDRRRRDGTLDEDKQ